MHIFSSVSALRALQRYTCRRFARATMYLFLERFRASRIKYRVLFSVSALRAPKCMYCWTFLRFAHQNLCIFERLSASRTKVYVFLSVSALRAPTSMYFWAFRRFAHKRVYIFERFGASRPILYVKMLDSEKSWIWRPFFPSLKLQNRPYFTYFYCRALLRSWLNSAAQVPRGSRFHRST